MDKNPRTTDASPILFTTDIYKVDVVNAGYVTRFKKYYNDMQKSIPAKYGLKTLICRASLDNLAQVERSLTYDIK